MPTPPPLGVGSRWALRAFGWSSTRTAIISRTVAADNSASVAANARWRKTAIRVIGGDGLRCAARRVTAIGAARKSHSAAIAPTWCLGRMPPSSPANHTNLFRPDASPQRVSTVDHQGGAGHVARGLAGQVHRERTEILRAAEIAHRYLRLEGGDDVRLLARPTLVWFRHEAAGQDGVDGDAVWRPVGRGDAGEVQDRGFGGLVVPAGYAAVGDQPADRGD